MVVTTTSYIIQTIYHPLNVIGYDTGWKNMLCLTSSIICSARDLVYHQTYATTINHMKSWPQNKKSTYRVSFEKPNSSSSRRSIFTPYFPTYGCPFPCLFKHKITTTDRFVNIAVCHKNQWLVSTSFFKKVFPLFCIATTQTLLG